MQWKLYWRNIVQHYQVVIDGWPAHIPFKNLSDCSSALSELENLLCMWKTGEVHWRKITATEFKEMESKRDNDVDAGVIEPPAPRCRRSDFGKKRPRPESSSTKTRRPSKKHKSRACVDESDSDNDDPEIAQQITPNSNNGEAQNAQQITPNSDNGEAQNTSSYTRSIQPQVDEA
jgi:hypothetical protein